MKKIIVCANGNGDYKTISEAIEKCSENTEIIIKKGIYKEKIIISKPNIKLVGEEKATTVLTYNSGAYDIGDDGNQIGTFKTATVHITKEATGFSAQNITFENTAGMGDIVGQAVALYVDCDKSIIKDCILRARQDTLLTAPIHLDIEENPYIKNRQYFENCLIEGDVDFIFGGAIAIFKKCEIKSLNRNKEINGYVTAACTSKKLEYGYVFIECNFTTDNCKNETVYIGRPWREYAKTVLINCNLDSHISKDGFSKWNETDRHKTCYYAQYGTKGIDCDNFVDWSYKLDAKQAELYTIDKIFEGWHP